MTTQKLQHYINHISLVVDKSSSMGGHANTVVKVFDKELAYLKQRSIDLNQETRISIYLFADSPRLEVLTFDMDVMRFNSLEGHYRPYGNTALLDAVAKSIEDHQKLPELYGDHAFLQYVITDGQENASVLHKTLPASIRSLPVNWTIACLVPDARGKYEAQKFGFHPDSIAVWDASSSTGFEGVGKQFSHVMDNYMTMRASGVRGTTGLFTLDTSNLNLAQGQLQEVPPYDYDIYRVDREIQIKPLVESWTQKPYRLGSAYYQPVKTVKIQDHKNILVQNAKNGRVYEGRNLRQLLGLPAQTAEVNPGSHSDWRIFVQSTSINRKLFPNTFVLVRK